jgi:uncharacterized protein (TIGR02246 family)
VFFRVTLVTLLLLTFAIDVRASDPAPPADKAADRAAIQAVLDAHGAAWSKGHAQAATVILTEDADWVSGSGKIFIGRAAIAKMHSDVLNGPAKGSRHSHPGIPSIRFITHDVAIVDGLSYMAGWHDEHGNELPGEYSRYTAVFLKKNGTWYVTAFRSLPQVKVAPPN